MWYKVNELFSNGPKFTQISQKLGIDRHRVSHYHQMSEAEFLMSDAYQRSYNRKLDTYDHSS